MTRVIDLRNPNHVYFYDLSPEQAVINAYAQQEKHDYNWWLDYLGRDYKARYGHLVQYTKHCVACGDYCALLEEKYSKPNGSFKIGFAELEYKKEEN